MGSFNPARGEGVSVEWYTPASIFDALQIHFDLDPASPVDGPVSWVPATHHLTMKEDGLRTPWKGRVWLNPPYGRDIRKWTGRMVAHGNGIMITFVRSDTAWWQEAAAGATAICFIRGRVLFVPGTKQAEGRRSPTDRPGASNCLFAYGEECALAVRRSGLGVTYGGVIAMRKEERLWSVK